MEQYIFDTKMDLEPQSGNVEHNIQEIKEELEKQIEPYKVYVVEDETQVKDAKTVMANLRKIKKMVDNRKKEVKKEYMKPYQQFENEVKELYSSIDDAVDTIKVQVDGYEEERKQRKQQEIMELYSSIVEEYPNVIEHLDDKDMLFDVAIFENKMLNKSETFNKIEEKMRNKLSILERAIKLIKDRDDLFVNEKVYINEFINVFAEHGEANEDDVVKRVNNEYRYFKEAQEKEEEKETENIMTYRFYVDNEEDAKKLHDKIQENLHEFFPEQVKQKSEYNIKEEK